MSFSGVYFSEINNMPGNRRRQQHQLTGLSGFRLPSTKEFGRFDPNICVYDLCHSRKRMGSAFCGSHACPEITCSNDKNCIHHMCQVRYCSRTSIDGSSYCKYHKCDLCRNEKTQCVTHLCSKLGCMETKAKNSKWCNDHKCEHCDNFYTCKIHCCQAENCVSSSMINSLYCQNHKCEYCEQRKGHCSIHTCKVDYCKDNRAEYSDYCKYHKCSRSDCFLEKKCPLHSCQIRTCWNQKYSINDQYCHYHKCEQCNNLRSQCVIHRCKKCKQFPAVKKYVYDSYIYTDYCADCICKSQNCIHETVNCRASVISKTYCLFHAPRCLDCSEIATHLSHFSSRGILPMYLFCHVHKCCSICKHKPRNPQKTICDGHLKRERQFPGLYHQTELADLKMRTFGYGVLMRSLFDKLYFQSSSHQYNRLPKIIQIQFRDNEIADILRHVLQFPQELYLEFIMFAFDI